MGQQAHHHEFHGADTDGRNREREQSQGEPSARISEPRLSLRIFTFQQANGPHRLAAEYLRVLADVGGPPASATAMTLLVFQGLRQSARRASMVGSSLVLVSLPDESSEGIECCNNHQRLCAHLHLEEY
ncbi:hypothetical protein OHS81_00410 [Streptomyces sp. NBC_00400]